MPATCGSTGRRRCSRRRRPASFTPAWVLQTARAGPGPRRCCTTPRATSGRSCPADRPSWIHTNYTINREQHGQRACVVHGVKPGEDPRRATLWVILGEPVCGVAVPLWVAAGAPPAALWEGERGGAGHARAFRLKDALRPLKARERQRVCRPRAARQRRRHRLAARRAERRARDDRPGGAPGGEEPPGLRAVGLREGRRREGARLAARPRPLTSTMHPRHVVFSLALCLALTVAALVAQAPPDRCLVPRRHPRPHPERGVGRARASARADARGQPRPAGARSTSRRLLRDHLHPRHGRRRPACPTCRWTSSRRRDTGMPRKGTSGWCSRRRRSSPASRWCRRVARPGQPERGRRGRGRLRRPGPRRRTTPARTWPARSCLATRRSAASSAVAVNLRGAAGALGTGSAGVHGEHARLHARPGRLVERVAAAPTEGGFGFALSLRQFLELRDLVERGAEGRRCGPTSGPARYPSRMNVVSAAIPGTDPAAGELILVAHAFETIATPGANDNCTGRRHDPRGGRDRWRG